MCPLTTEPIHRKEAAALFRTNNLHKAMALLLFVALLIRLLRVGGRCACIVPDGVLFGSSKAHASLRKEIVESQYL
jgi:type I restriction-modification system DNA methylase subunit